MSDRTSSYSYEFVDNSHVEKKSNVLNLGAWLKQVWKCWVHQFVNSHEPYVWQKRDGSGQPRYYAYDPITKRSLSCTTETEVRIWLEQLPYL